MINVLKTLLSFDDDLKTIIIELLDSYEITDKRLVFKTNKKNDFILDDVIKKLLDYTKKKGAPQTLIDKVSPLINVKAFVKRDMGDPDKILGLIRKVLSSDLVVSAVAKGMRSFEEANQEKQMHGAKESGQKFKAELSKIEQNVEENLESIPEHEEVKTYKKSTDKTPEEMKKSWGNIEDYSEQIQAKKRIYGSCCHKWGMRMYSICLCYKVGYYWRIIF